MITEYCSGEIFSPECRANEVIVMREAVYGLMHRGKCAVHRTELGCQKDMIEMFDSKCSNKKNCEVNVFMDLHSLEPPCPSGIVKFLEADYTCEQGIIFSYKLLM